MSRPKSAAATAGRKRRQSASDDEEEQSNNANSENNESENESGSGSASDGGDESAGYTEGEEDDEGNKKPRRRKQQQPKDQNRAGSAVASTSAAANASSNKGKNAGEKGGADQTDIHALDDAVGISGVDLNAEEEAIRATNLKPRNAQQQAAARAKAKPQLILDEQALRDAVLRIAASFQLRNLESDTLPLIGLAVQMRLRRLIEAMIAAKEHRVTSNHQRPPPMFPPLGDPNELPAPMWDQVMYDDVEKIMGTIDRVEREEERQARKDRLRRDQAEQEERERLERLAQEGGEDGAGSGEGGAGTGDVSMAEASGSGSMPGTPSGASFGAGDRLGKSVQGGTGTGTKGEKKRKRETPAQTARNMSDDVRKKLSDQTALRNLGTKKRYSWMGGGPADSPLLKKNLPKPKFPPLPPSSMRVTTNADDDDTSVDDKSKVKGEGTDADGPLSSNPTSALARLTAVPSAHSASKATNFGGNSMLEDPGNQYVTIRDAIFVLENERGKGAGIGSGTKALYRAHMGRV